MLKGTELLDTIRSMETASRTEQCLACGYVRENGKPAFTDFYTAILDARGITINESEPEEIEEIKAEDPNNQETINQLLEDYDAAAIEAFIELNGEENVEHFEDAYQGEMSGAEFAEQFTTDCYCVDIPTFVCVDWEATWQQLCYDYDEQDGYIFASNW